MTSPLDASPLIWTSHGNLPVDSLRYEKEWTRTDDYIKFEEQYFLGDELVRNNVHILGLRPLTIGGEQAALPA